MVIDSSFLPGPTATTVPLRGFSFAVSGMIIPLVVFCSAGAVLQELCSQRFKFQSHFYVFNLPRYVEIYAKPQYDIIISVIE